MKVLSIILLLGLFSSCIQNEQSKKNDQDNTGNLNTLISQVQALPIYDLTNQQREDLKYMWEEEKLARDVYITLSYQGKVFQNISKSEQSHMNAISALIQKYSITATGTDTVGQFSTIAFQTLYNDLVTRGQASNTAAFSVGIDIEILDINDLEDRIIGAPEDFRLIFQKLIDASYKHKRAFERQL